MWAAVWALAALGDLVQMGLDRSHWGDGQGVGSTDPGAQSRLRAQTSML